MKSFENIVITGASNGIGKALALDYAAPGITLGLNGRDAPRLQAVAAACRAKGAIVEARPLSVTDRKAMASWLTGFNDAHPVDLLVANAGVSIDKDNSSMRDFSIIRATMGINFDGTLNAIEPLIGRLVARKMGQIAIVSSLASFIGLPYSGAYSASKAALRVWGENARYVLKKDGVGVSIICPGFVETGITAEAPFSMPFMISAQKASAIIRRGLARNKARISFPLPMKAAMWVGNVLPGTWTTRLLGGG